MKYCSKCKKIYINQDTEICLKCGKKLIHNPNLESPVRMVTANGFELERIKAALKDAEIPFSVKQESYDTGLQILNSAPPENCTFFVPIKCCEEAAEILIGIGALSEKDWKEFDEKDLKYLEQSKDNGNEKELSPQKARLIRILSFIGFLIAIAGATWLIDYLLYLVTLFWRR